MANMFRSVLETSSGGGGNIQEYKSVTADTDPISVVPDAGYDGIAVVGVGPTPSQTKSVTPTSSSQTVTPDEGKLLSSVTVNAVPTQTKSATPTSSSQTITPDSGKYLSSVTVGAVSLQSKSVTPTSSQQTITPDSGYSGLSSVTVGAVSLQTKTTNVTPSANWSGANTQTVAITPDSGYSGMDTVNVSVPMVRDNSLFTASTVDTPGTVYNGDTPQSNSKKLLRIAPTKTGMVYTNSYLYLQPNSYLGNATTDDVAAGKTFTSANGIQLTGTGSGGSDVHIDQQVTLNTTGNTSVTFTDSRITSATAIDVYTDIFGVNPISVDVKSGSCVIIFPPYLDSTTITCRIYIKT